MFIRAIQQELEIWSLQQDRKPMVIRGARQVGKTTLVEQFSTKYEQYIYMNLELAADKQPFLDFTNIETLVQALFFII